MDIMELQKRLWKEVRAYEGRIGRDTRFFLRRFIKRLKKEGYSIGPEAERELTRYLERVHDLVKRGVRSSIAGAVSLAPASMKSELANRLMAEAFDKRWPDGLTLSDRIWWWQDETRRGVSRILSEGIRMGEAVSRLIYRVQYGIEAGSSPFLTVTSDEIGAWAKDLMDSARAVIKNPSMHRKWEETVLRARQYIEDLSRQGSYHASKRLLNELQRAVENGRAELIEDAIRWFHYDRQLYLIKRVVRTEMATAHHNGVIEATKADDDIIGYHWRLSPSHPRPDICDFYASVDFGLGRGVFPKDKVPKGKAHPQCMCILVPRVRKIKKRGSTSFKEFLNGLSDAKRSEIMPKWAQELEGAGVPFEKLVRKDGMDFLSRKEIEKALGKERLSCLQGVGRALGKREWTDFDRHVAKRIEDGSIRSARELDRRFERALRHKDTEIWGIFSRDGKVSQYYGLNRRFNEVTVIRKNGVRATWFPLNPPDVDKFIERQRAKVTKKEFKHIGKLEELWKMI